MPDRRRYFLTTAIAYANNRPGLHTLYEVVAADVLARWHRMIGDDTRFLTGTDEYSVNIAMTAEEQGKTPKALRRRDGRAVPDGRGGSRDLARPVHPDDRPGPPARGPRVHPARLRQGRPLPEHVRGLVLPERGVHPEEPARRGRGRDPLRQPPHGQAPVAVRAQLVLPPLEVPGGARAALRRPPGLGPARVPQERDARVHGRRPGGLLGQPPEREVGHPVPDRRGRRFGPARRRLVGSRGGHGLRLVRRAHQLRHRGWLPGRSRLHEVVAGRSARHRQGHQPPPHDHVAGDAHERGPAPARGGSGSMAGSWPRASG